MEINKVKFEIREGSSGYVVAALPTGQAIWIYLQYAHPVALARENGISREDAAELIAAARDYKPEAAQSKSEVEAEALPADVAELVNRYGSSEAAWEAEDEVGCFRMREFGF